MNKNPIRAFFVTPANSNNEGFLEGLHQSLWHESIVVVTHNSALTGGTLGSKVLFSHAVGMMSCCQAVLQLIPHDDDDPFQYGLLEVARWRTIPIFHTVEEFLEWMGTKA